MGVQIVTARETETSAVGAHIVGTMKRFAFLQRSRGGDMRNTNEVPCLDCGTTGKGRDEVRQGWTLRFPLCPKHEAEAVARMEADRAAGDF